MKMILITLCIGLAATIGGQTNSPQLMSIVGVVTNVDAAASSAVIKTDQGTNIHIKVNANTTYLRVPIGAQSLEQATPIKFSDLSAGDRVLAKGPKSDNTNDFEAMRIVVLTKSDVTKKQQDDIAQWQKRGVTGLVKAADRDSGQISLELRGSGAGSLINVNAAKADFRRYSSVSTRFEDAAPSNISALEVGDQLRALGQKSGDGKTFEAQVIVSGSFRTIGATITAVDLQTGEVKASTLDQRKPIAIVVHKESAIHRIPASLVPAIVQLSRPSRPTQTASPPAAAPAASSNGQTQELQTLIDALPKLNLSDIKVGDVIAVTCPREKDESRIVAIKLVAGVDQVLRALAGPPGRPQTVRLSAGLPSAFDFSVIPVN